MKWEEDGHDVLDEADRREIKGGGKGGSIIYGGMEELVQEMLVWRYEY